MSANAGEEGGADNSANEWTHIGRKGKRNYKKQIGHAPPAAGSVDNFRPNPAPTLSAYDIHAEHEQVSAAWRGTAACAQLRTLLQSNSAECVGVRRAICLGLGAFDPEDGAWVARRRAHVQLAAFLTMVEALQARGGSGAIECFYQEPRFALPDKQFIERLGGKVIESPASYELVDEETLVFGVHLYRDIWAAALEKGFPAVFVGTGWDIWEVSPGADIHPDFARIRQMHEGAFAKFTFPQDEHHSFSSTCIYWKLSDHTTREIPKS